jgi:retron-type reverse transcriptase
LIRIEVSGKIFCSEDFYSRDCGEGKENQKLKKVKYKIQLSVLREQASKFDHSGILYLARSWDYWVNYVIEADIKHFFDKVSHYWMIRCLKIRIKEPSLLLLIRRFLKDVYIDEGEFVFTTEGTLQGSNFGPILSYIFLHCVLDLWFENKVRPRVKGVCQLVRYVDDARHMEQAMLDRFARFGLELHHEKTRVIAFDVRAANRRSSS